MHIKDINEIDLKKLIKKLTLVIPAQHAKLSPPVGPILGQVKIKVKDFCTLFNTVTLKYPSGLPLPVIVYVFKNETYMFIIKTPFNNFLIKNCEALNEYKGITFLDLYKIVLIKEIEYPHLSRDVIMQQVLERVLDLKVKILE